MTTAGERLATLAGTTGTAATLLLLIGTGVTAGDALVDYSMLTTSTAAEHLMTDAVASAGFEEYRYDRFIKRRKSVEDVEALLMIGLL